MYLLGVLALVVGILLSIALHEIGHLVPAKRFGVKCTQYMVGFGPTVWSRRVGDTEYGVKAVPLGGYVRMIGMFPPRRDGSRAPTTRAAGPSSPSRPARTRSARSTPRTPAASSTSARSPSGSSSCSAAR